MAVDAFLIVLRESLEAFLILSIFAGLVVKLGKPETRRFLLWGALAALVASVVAGVIVDATVREVFDSTGSGEWVEGVASLLAVLILTYMVVWMYRHTIHLVAEMRHKAVAALDAGRPGLLFAIAFVAVAREGLETVLFFATLAPTTTPGALVLAAVAGIAVSAIIAWLVFSGIVRLNIKRFFTVTGVLLILFAGGLVMTGIHELSEVGVLPETGKAWNTEWLLDQHSAVGAVVKAVFGYRESPTYFEAAAYVLYVFGLGAWYLGGLLRRLGRGVPVEAAPART